MSRANDIASLFGGDPSDLGFAQGLVVAWDEETGTNAVNVKGTNLTNLPALHLGEFVILAPGDVVALLRFKSTYFILGRVILPSAPDRNRASLDFTAAGQSQSNFNMTVAGNVRAMATITVPDWADHVLIHATGDATFANRAASVQFVFGRIDFTTGTGSGGGGENFTQLDPGEWGHIACSAIASIPRDALVNNQFTAGMHLRMNSATSPADVANLANMNASVIFRRAD